MADRWKEISRLYYAALDRPTHMRMPFLEKACAGDWELHHEIAALLDCHSDAQMFMAAPAMTIMSKTIAADVTSLLGRQLGCYRVDSCLGAGGMGEVYKATDIRLHRSVAVKILPQHLRTDAYLRQRFQQEAEVVAAVRHPHICVLHDIGQDGEIAFLVMEYLEGETVAERLRRGPLAASEVFRYGTEIADALVATHHQGITHRDLKPGNVMLTASGAKLLDFGLATLQSAISPATIEVVASDSGTPSRLAGTLPYMAPEQLQGGETGPRTDIFAFGALLYEMVTGEAAFDAPSRSGVAAAVITGEPAPMAGALPPTARSLEPLIKRCLAKSPADRWQSIDDVADELRRLARHASRAAPDVGTGRGRRTRYAMWAITSVAVAAGAVGWIANLTHALRGRPSSVASSPFTPLPPLLLGNMRPLTAEAQLEVDPEISPDGTLVAYGAGTANGMRIFIRAVAGGPSRPLSADSSVRQFQPRWSPDGRQILYITLEGAFLVPALGGAPRRLDSLSDESANHSLTVNAGVRVFGATWSPDGREVAIAYGGSLTVVTLNGGQRRHLSARSSDELHHCDWSPNGRWIACATGNWRFASPAGDFGNIAPSAIVLIPAAGGPLLEITDHTAQNMSPVWSRDSRRLYFVSNRHGTGDVYAVEVSEDGHLRDAAVRVTTGLGAQSIAFSGDRTRLAYTVYSARANVWSLPVPSRGPVDISRAKPLTTGDQVVEAVTLSPDGEWLLYDSTLYGNADIFRIPAGGGQAEQLTTNPAADFAPNLSPDGRLLAFHSWRTGTRDVFVQSLGGGLAEQVTGTSSQESYPVWLPDRRSLMFFDQTVSNGVVRGAFVVRRQKGETWGLPRRMHFPDHVNSAQVLSNHLFAYARNGGVEIGTADGDLRRSLYRPVRQSIDPIMESVRVAPGDSSTVYAKSHDAEGRASFWAIPTSGGLPLHLVRFDDLSRPSTRREFAVGGGQFYFTVDDRRSNVWLADVTER